MNDLEAIRSLDYSDRYTTDLVQCLELYSLVKLWQPQSILELGAGFGISGVAIGLAAPEVEAVSVDYEEIKRDKPISLWQKYGVKKQYVKSLVSDYLKSSPKFDFIFHDANHGAAAVPEYRRCWELTNKLLAIHDVHMIDYRALVRSLPDVLISGMTFDAKGRGLGYVVKR